MEGSGWSFRHTARRLRFTSGDIRLLRLAAIASVQPDALFADGPKPPTAEFTAEEPDARAAAVAAAAPLAGGADLYGDHAQQREALKAASGARC